MNNESEVKALFVLCQDLKTEVKSLTEKIEALSAAQITSQNCNCSKEIEEIQVEITDLVDFQIEESAKASKELDLVDNAMDRLFNRTNDLRTNQTKLVNQLKMLSAPQAMSVSVKRQDQPQTSKSSQNQRSRIRICYNCRKPGHLAVNCLKSNPRLKGLSAPPPPKSKRTVRFESQEPATNSVDVAAEPEVSATFGTVIVPVKADGSYTPFVYPNGSSNPMMKHYSWAELNRAVTPYGS